MAGPVHGRDTLLFNKWSHLGAHALFVGKVGLYVVLHAPQNLLSTNSIDCGPLELFTGREVVQLVDECVHGMRLGTRVKD